MALPGTGSTAQRRLFALFAVRHLTHSERIAVERMGNGGYSAHAGTAFAGRYRTNIGTGSDLLWFLVVIAAAGSQREYGAGKQPFC